VEENKGLEIETSLAQYYYFSEKYTAKYQGNPFHNYYVLEVK